MNWQKEVEAITLVVPGEQFSPVQKDITLLFQHIELQNIWIAKTVRLLEEYSGNVMGRLDEAGGEGIAEVLLTERAKVKVLRDRLLAIQIKVTIGRMGSEDLEVIIGSIHHALEATK